MTNEDKKMDEILRRRMEYYTADPPDRVWQAIHSRLELPGAKRRRPVLVWLPAAAVLVLSIITGILLNDPAETSSSLTAEKPQIPAGNSESVRSGPAAGPEILPRQEPIDLNVAAKQKDRLPHATPSLERNNTLAAASGAADESLRMPALKAIRKLVVNENPSERIRTDAIRAASPENSLSDLDRLIIAGNLARPGDREDDGRHPWKVGVHLSPGYSSHTSSHSALYAGNMTYADDKSVVNVGGGVSVQYKTDSRWRLETGMYYAQAGGNSVNSNHYNVFRADLAAGSLSAEKYFNTGVSVNDGLLEMNSTAGVISFSHTPEGAELVSSPESASRQSTVMLTEGEFNQVFDFVEIPLMARYRVLESRMGVELVGGLSTNITIGNNVYMDTPAGREQVGTTRDISTLNFSGTAGVGVIYAVGKNLSLSVEPRLNYYINSINHSGEVQFKPWRVGLFTGLSYEF